jgi:formylmethanofuran:tetrahydromethanopterin formyltransferase
METRLERVGALKVVKQSSIGYILENGVEIVDTFAEMFPMWAGRVLVTADSEAWAMAAAATATGLATSVQA